MNNRGHKRKLNIRVVIFFTLVILIFISLIYGLVSLVKSIVRSDDNQVANNDSSSVELVEENNQNAFPTKEEEKKFSKLPEWRETAVQDIKDIYGSDEKQVFLTFDDGPSSTITPIILDILKEEEVPATFFVLGKEVELYPELVRQEYEAGHFIANHGYSHEYSKIYASVDSVFDEYNRTNAAIQEALGKPEYDPHLFRFPGGSSGGRYDSLKAKAKTALAENQIASTNWNCLSSDAAGKTTVEGQYQDVLDTAGNKTSLIILMHDEGSKKATPETLKLVIKRYKELGYEFKNFYDIMNNDNLPETEDVAETDAESHSQQVENTNTNVVTNTTNTTVKQITNVVKKN